MDPIRIPQPQWNSSLTAVILDLEKLRTHHLRGEIPPYIFFQLKDIFQMLESLGSARIEGNNTTLAEYVEKTIEKNQQKDESYQELKNLEDAIRFIEENTDNTTQFTRAYVSQLHIIITRNLTPPPHGEGSNYPGLLRPHNVTIGKSAHVPVDYVSLPDYFDQFLSFLNTKHQEQNQLLMLAIAHHRFAYIHPFDNGNGRMGRMLNYALLIKLGFNVKAGRILNPSSVFYTDRDKYYNKLAAADSLKDDALLNWAEYFLLGLKNEVEKVDSLTRRAFTRDNILIPSIQRSLSAEQITAQEANLLQYLVGKEEMAIKAEELEFMGMKNSKKKSNFIAKLRGRGILKPLKKGGRIYTINFVNTYLLRHIIFTLGENGFIADFLNTATLD